ncbi:hypothetical protein ACHAXT_009861 [Thalassiosira profunda]
MWNRIAASVARATTSAVVRTSVAGPARTAVPALNVSVSSRAFSSDYGESITYSGGQASEGQGGFYGSGGARVSKMETEHRPEMLALAADVENLTLVMTEISKMDAELEEAKEGSESGVTGKSLEISSKIKKIMTSEDVMSCLNRLEVEGETITLHSQIAASLESDEPNKHQLQLQSSTSTSSENASPFVGLPSYRRVLFFVATTFLIWVSEPLLSLVDSAAVGRYAGKAISGTGSSPNLSSVIQLAALGPATMLCDSSIYLTMFISMATTNKLARAFAKDSVEEQIQTLSHVMGVSLVVGTILLLLINFQGAGLLASILGPAGATVSVEAARGAMKTVDLTPEVLHAALGYSRIRAAVSPLAVMGLTSQAALLCAQDTKTPALAVLVASVVNIVGDYILVAKMGYGVHGAALATSMASVAANSILVRTVWKMMRGWKSAYRKRPAAEDRNEGETQQPSNTATDPTDTPFISLPDRASLVSLLKLSGPLFFVMVGKIFGYSAMTVRAGTFGMVSLACHNVLMRIFFFFATVGDALSQSAQTFLPGLFYQKSLQENDAEGTPASADVSKKNDGDDNNARTLLKRILLISTIAGVINCVAGRTIAHTSGGTFTTDASLVSLMSHVSPFMGLALLLHPLTMALEGSIIAANDAKYLVGTYGLSLIVLLSQLRFVCRDFLGVWHGILVFQMIRITQFGARVWKRTASNKKSKIQVKSDDTPLASS